MRTGRSTAASPRSPNSHHPSPAIGIAARIRSSDIGRHRPSSPGATALPARSTYSSHSERRGAVEGGQLTPGQPGRRVGGRTVAEVVRGIDARPAHGQRVVAVEGVADDAGVLGVEHALEAVRRGGRDMVQGEQDVERLVDHLEAHLGIRVEPVDADPGEAVADDVGREDGGDLRGRQDHRVRPTARVGWRVLQERPGRPSARRVAGRGTRPGRTPADHRGRGRGPSEANACPRRTGPARPAGTRRVRRGGRRRRGDPAQAPRPASSRRASRRFSAPPEDAAGADPQPARRRANAITATGPGETCRARCDTMSRCAAPRTLLPTGGRTPRHRHHRRA